MAAAKAPKAPRAGKPRPDRGRRPTPQLRVGCSAATKEQHDKAAKAENARPRDDAPAPGQDLVPGADTKVERPKKAKE